jgi:hypothetical protein
MKCELRLGIIHLSALIFRPLNSQPVVTDYCGLLFQFLKLLRMGRKLKRRKTESIYRSLVQEYI